MLNLYETSILAPLAILRTKCQQWGSQWQILAPVAKLLYILGCSVLLPWWLHSSEHYHLMQKSSYFMLSSMFSFFPRTPFVLFSSSFFFFFLGPWSASQAICYCLWIHIHSNIGQFYFYRKCITSFPIWDSVHWEDFPSLFPVSVIKEAIMQLLSIFIFFDISFFCLNFILFLNFTILYWFCQILKWIRHRFRLYSYTELIFSWTNLALCLPPYVGYKSPLYCYSYEMGKICVLERHWWIKQGL